MKKKKRKKEKAVNHFEVIQKSYKSIEIEETTFYNSNIIAEKEILEIKSKGNLYKAVRYKEHSKIVARINDTLYNFPAIITERGTSKKIAETYRELRRREGVEENIKKLVANNKYRSLRSWFKLRM